MHNMAKPATASDSTILTIVFKYAVGKTYTLTTYTELSRSTEMMLWSLEIRFHTNKSRVEGPFLHRSHMWMNICVFI